MYLHRAGKVAIHLSDLLLKALFVLLESRACLSLQIQEHLHHLVNLGGSLPKLFVLHQKEVLLMFKAVLEVFYLLPTNLDRGNVIGELWLHFLIIDGLR